MKLKFSYLNKTIALAILSLVGSSICKADGSYHPIREIAIIGEKGATCLAIDEGNRRLYVGHDTKVSVINLLNDKLVFEFTNAAPVNDVALAPKLRRGFVSLEHGSNLNIFDLVSSKNLSKMDARQNVSALLFQPTRMQIFAFCGEDHSVSLFEADDGDFLANIKLSGTPGVAAADPKTGRVYCSIKDKDQIVVLDPVSRKVTNSWSSSPVEGNVKVAVDATRHRLFLGGSNRLLAMTDLNNGKIFGTVVASGPIDAIAFDPATQFVFANSKGIVTIAREYTLQSLTEVQTLETKSDARAMALDSTTHQIYLASPNSVSGSFKLFVYGPDKGGKR